MFQEADFKASQRKRLRADVLIQNNLFDITTLHLSFRAAILSTLE